jgi:hypothetical protein
MSSAIHTLVAMPCLLQERECPFAYTPQPREHRFLVGKLCRRGHDRGDLAFDRARFNQRQRKMQPLMEGYAYCCFSDEAVGQASDAALDVTSGGLKFAC